MTLIQLRMPRVKTGVSRHFVFRKEASAWHLPPRTFRFLCFQFLVKNLIEKRDKQVEILSEEDIKLTIEAERQHELIAKGCVHLSDGTKVVTREFDCVLYLERLMDTAKKIASSKDDVSKLVETKAGSGRYVVRFNRFGRALILACKVYQERFLVGIGQGERPRYGNHKFHPYLDVMMTEIGDAEAAINRALHDRQHEVLHEAIAALVGAIRSRCNTPEFKKEVRNFERNAEAKLRRALCYLLSLFKKRSRLLVLRVDLYVREEGKAWSYTAEADHAFDKFAAALSASQIVPDVMGWMSAREDGVERGRHYHILAIVDGHEHHAGANLARMLGEYWVKECVGSDKLGSYFNCFALVHKYKHLGIGMIHCTDAKKLLGLYYATRYLCKSEVELIATGDRPRNFRRGKEDKAYVRRGAPRAHGEDLSLARQILFGEMRPIKPRGRKEPAGAIQQTLLGQYPFPP